MEALMFVHPGYLIGQGVEVIRVYKPKFMSRNSGKWEHVNDRSKLAEIRKDLQYGSYDIYRANLKKLYHSYVGQKMFVVERKKDKLHPYHSGFEPTKDSLVFEWGFNGLSLIERNRDSWRLGQIFESKEDFSQFIRDKGIDFVLLAGELGPMDKGNLNCVGTMYSYLFQGGIETKGVKDCIFPIVPYLQLLASEYWASLRTDVDGTSDLEKLATDEIMQRRIFKDLYDNAVLI